MLEKLANQCLRKDFLLLENFLIFLKMMYLFFCGYMYHLNYSWSLEHWFLSITLLLSLCLGSCHVMAPFMLLSH